MAKAKGQAKFELKIGALDKFSGPFKAFSSTVGKARAEVGKFGQAAKGLTGGLGSALGGLGKLAGAFGLSGLFGGGLSVAGLGALTKSFADAGDEAAKTAQKLGLTTRQWQEMAYAASFNDVTNEQLQDSYLKLNQSLISAAKGGKTQAEAFKKLGVALRNEKGELRATDSLMMDVAEGLSNMEDGAKKSALANAIFGESGAKLLPFLNNGRKGLKDLRIEAGKMGLVMKTEATKASEAFNDRLTKLGWQVKGLGYDIGASFLPVADDLVAMFSDLVGGSRNLISTKIGQWAQNLRPFVAGLGEGFRGLAAAVGPSFKALFESVGGIFHELGPDLRDANGELNPEGWRELGLAVAKFVTDNLGALIKALKAVIDLFKDVGGWLGSTAGKLVTGVDLNQFELADKEYAQLIADIKASAASNGGQLSERSMVNIASRLQGMDDRRDDGGHYWQTQFLGSKNWRRNLKSRFGITDKASDQAYAAQAKGLVASLGFGPNRMAEGSQSFAPVETRHVERNEINLVVRTEGGLQATVDAGQLPDGVSVTSQPSYNGVANYGG